MNDTRTSVLRHEGGAEDLEAAIGGPALEAVKQWLVFLADESLALELFNHGVTLDFALLNYVVKTTLHADIHLLRLVDLKAHVLELGIDSEGQVTRERPGGGRPCDEVGLLVVLQHGERDDDSGIWHVLVVRASFEI